MFIKLDHAIGMAYRFCNSAENWETPIVTNCLSFEYAALMQEVVPLTIPKLADSYVIHKG